MSSFEPLGSEPAKISSSQYNPQNLGKEYHETQNKIERESEKVLAGLQKELDELNITARDLNRRFVTQTNIKSTGSKSPAGEKEKSEKTGFEGLEKTEDFKNLIDEAMGRLSLIDSHNKEAVEHVKHLRDIAKFIPSQRRKNIYEKMMMSGGGHARLILGIDVRKATSEKLLDDLINNTVDPAMLSPKDLYMSMFMLHDIITVEINSLQRSAATTKSTTEEDGQISENEDSLQIFQKIEENSQKIYDLQAKMKSEASNTKQKIQQLMKSNHLEKAEKERASVKIDEASKEDGAKIKKIGETLD